MLLGVSDEELLRGVPDRKVSEGSEEADDDDQGLGTETGDGPGAGLARADNPDRPAWFDSTTWAALPPSLQQQVVQAGGGSSKVPTITLIDPPQLVRGPEGETASNPLLSFFSEGAPRPTGASTSKSDAASAPPPIRSDPGVKIPIGGIDMGDFSHDFCTDYAHAPANAFKRELGPMLWKDMISETEWKALDDTGEPYQDQDSMAHQGLPQNTWNICGLLHGVVIQHEKKWDKFSTKEKADEWKVDMLKPVFKVQYTDKNNASTRN